jgi:hypothetical protein
LSKSEALVQSLVRIRAPSLAMHLWRNNCGQLKDANGRPVRYGLANDSKLLNREVKSGDLVGWTRHTITAADVGRTVAIFTSIECKPEDWTPPCSGAEFERYMAQLAWAKLVTDCGGIAKIVSSDDQL